MQRHIKALPLVVKTGNNLKGQDGWLVKEIFMEL